jgi:hypothetical protein
LKALEVQATQVIRAMLEIQEIQGQAVVAAWQVILAVLMPVLLVVGGRTNILGPAIILVTPHAGGQKVAPVIRPLQCQLLALQV